jgi:hypothetical protein
MLVGYHLVVYPFGRSEKELFQHGVISATRGSTQKAAPNMSKLTKPKDTAFLPLENTHSQMIQSIQTEKYFGNIHFLKRIETSQCFNFNLLQVSLT